MGFTDYDDYEYAEVAEGLELLGWEPYGRCTSDDASFLTDIAKQAISLRDTGKLDYEKIIELSFDAYNVLHFQIMGLDERLRAICGRYRNSKYLKQLLPMIDESLICYYRGYYTASLSLLFIVLERYLRLVYGWKPGDKNPSFSKLTKAIKKLPEASVAEHAYKIIRAIYGWYDSSNPPDFYFNRHGLLHGMLNTTSVDQMNCTRLFVLFDTLCSAEGIPNSLIGDDYVALKIRTPIYSNCRFYKSEMMLLSMSDNNMIALAKQTFSSDEPKENT